MGGWRDPDGRTARERRTASAERDRAQFAAEVRHRPLSVLKGLAGFVLIIILVLAIVGWLR